MQITLKFVENQVMDSKKRRKRKRIASISTITESSTSMQYKLKQWYKLKLTIPQAAWMEHSMESSIQDFYFDLHLSSNQVINHNQLFDDLKVKRILIEGLPGYGKTTLVTKIAYDWASNEQYTQRFDLVFLVTIRELQEKSVTDVIVELVNIAGYEQPDEVSEKIEKNEDKILLLLDGLDEVPPKVRDKILGILYKKEMKQITVVVTCRSGEFSLDHGESRNLFGGLPAKREFWDKRINVLGICEEQKTEFLKKFLHETESVENVIEHLENMTETAQELFDSPLMLILLADMAVRGEKIGPVTSKTSFYKDVVNFMIRRSEERRNEILTTSFTVFDAKNRENNLFKIKLRQFGHLCFQRVWSGNQLEFDDNELTREIHKLGLLIIQKKMSNTRCKNCYQIYHRTILEFMTAYYIFEDFQHNNLQFSKDIEQKLIEDVIDSEKSSMVTPFLIGLMRDKACYYFNLMSAKYIDIFQYNPIALWRILMDCECLDQVENSLISNLPKYMLELSPISKDLLQYYYSGLPEHLLKLGTQSGRTEHIILDANVSDNSGDKIQGYDFLQTLRSFTNGFQILMYFPSKLYTLESINESNSIYLRHLKDDELDKNVVLNLITYPRKIMNRIICENLHKSVFERICNVLDRFHINLFNLNVNDGTDVIKYLPHCKEVNHLVLKCEQMSSISMDALFLDKQWESVRLINIKLTPPATKEFYACKSVEFLGVSENSVLSKISGVSHLGCLASTLHELMLDPSWPNWHILTAIYLFMDLHSYEFWEKFKLFPNLQLLQIENWSYPIQNSVHPDILPKILQLPIETLIVEFKNHFDGELSFIHNLRTFLKNHSITSLKTLVFHIGVDEKCPPDKIENDFVEKCAKVLKFCSEKNMSLKTIEIILPERTPGVFDIEHCNLNVKYWFKEEALVSVSMSNR